MRFLELIFLVFGFSCWGSTRVGNGGDVVHCSPSPHNSFRGFYSYDYLATYNLQNENRDIVAVSSWKQSSDRLGYHLLSYFSRYSSDFMDFVDNVENYTDLTASRVWKMRPGELIDLPNMPHFRSLPENCDQVYQAVIRYKLGEQVVYEVNPWIINELKKKPLQFSFLMLHEFLWDLFEKFPDNRVDSVTRFELIRFLHSEFIDTWEPKTVMQYLRGLGFDLDLLSEWKEWSEKYSPQAEALYQCHYHQVFSDPTSFFLRFSGLSYLGSSGGYFYDNVDVVDSLGNLETRLFSRPVGTEGVYVFENKFDIQLISENPLDGSFENNLSEKMGLVVTRGGGECQLVLP